MFQQAPYRFMPAGFEDSGVPSVVSTPYELVEPGHLFDSYGWFMDELLAGLRAGFDGVAVTEHGQTSYDMTPNPNLPAAVLANAIRARAPGGGADRARALAGKDARAAQDRGGVRDARLHERWAARSRAAGRAQLRREPEQRNPDCRDSRPLPREPRPRDPFVDRERALPVEWALLAVLARQLVAASSAETASTGLGAGIRFAGDDVLDDRAELRVRLPELVRADADRSQDLRSLLGDRRQSRVFRETRIASASSRVSSCPRPTSAPKSSTDATSRTPSGRVPAASRFITWGCPGTSNPAASRRCCVTRATSGSQPSCSMQRSAGLQRRDRSSPAARRRCATRSSSSRRSSGSATCS